MDKRVDPCHDFYQFACGNFKKDTAVDGEESRIEYMSLLSEQVQNQLRVSISNGFTGSDLRAFVVLHSYYSSCINTGIQFS